MFTFENWNQVCLFYLCIDLVFGIKHQRTYFICVDIVFFHLFLALGMTVVYTYRAHESAMKE